MSKQFLTFIMCMVMILLTACSQSSVTSNVEEQDDILDLQYSPPLYSTYHFDTYDDVIEALTMKNTESYNEIRQQNAHLELSELYMTTLSAFESGSLKLAVPQLAGEDISFRNWGEGYSNITLFAQGLHRLPWIWYHCVVDDFKLTVRFSYVSVLEQDADDIKSALEVVKKINPDAPNPQNYKETDTYTRIYEDELQLSDRKVKALIFEMNDDPRIYVDVYMDGMYIRLVAEKELLTEEFFKKFSIRYAS